jgi:hypothetical protein
MSRVYEKRVSTNQLPPNTMRSAPKEEITASMYGLTCTARVCVRVCERVCGWVCESVCECV